MLVQHLFRIGYGGEVHLFIPFKQEGAVYIKLFLCFRAENNAEACTVFFDFFKMKIRHSASPLFIYASSL